MHQQNQTGVPVEIDDRFWSERRRVNRERAIYYQWEQYEKTGTLDNFRIAAGLKQGLRRGIFFTDSDAHKWAEAASLILAGGADARLERLLDEYIGLVVKAQAADGYLYTYNQIHFPTRRWDVLQIEHELYCHGHFIEAGIAHYQATGRRDLLDAVIRAADLIAREFQRGSPVRNCLHPEIELALMRLYRLTGNKDYLETSRAMLERRGRGRFYGLSMLRDLVVHIGRTLILKWRYPRAISQSFINDQEHMGCQRPRFLALRHAASVFSGEYSQQNKPLRELVEPSGHAVMWGYLSTAAAMLYTETNDQSLVIWMRAAWENMVGRKMYVTGGVGSLPMTEGFGHAFELDNRYAYNETCAAIAGIFWNRELALSGAQANDPHAARYADLIEWQLYNAASVGIALTGDKYFYHNPLQSDGTLERQDWFSCCCCPSNLSRLLGDLGSYIYTLRDDALWINQYVGNHSHLADGLDVRMISELPWEGRVVMEIDLQVPECSVWLRLPGWADRGEVRVNGKCGHRFERQAELRFGLERFDRAVYISVRIPAGKTVIELDLPMSITPLRSHPAVTNNQSKIAITRGPLVYCWESMDHPGVDTDTFSVEVSSLSYAFDPNLIPGGSGIVRGRSATGAPLLFVPYFTWSNRGRSALRVWLRVTDKVRGERIG